MVYDIHAYWEIKLNGKWYVYDQPRFKQNYALFAKMANVENDGTVEPISLPKGLPQDASEVVKFEAEWWGNDGYFHSWLDSKEIEELYQFHVELYERENMDTYLVDWEEWGYVCDCNWADFYRYKDKIGYLKVIEDIRLVFWFDS